MKEPRHLESEQSLSFVISSTDHCFTCREISNKFSTPKRKRQLTFWQMQFSLCGDVALPLAFQNFWLSARDIPFFHGEYDKVDQQPGKTTVVSTQFNGLVVMCLGMLKVELLRRKCKGRGFNSAWRTLFLLCPCKYTSTPSDWLEIRRTWIWTETRVTRWLVLSFWYQWGVKY